MWEIFIWYIAIFTLGIISFPIGKYLFDELDDFAYPFYRIIGLAIVSYFVWIMGLLHLLPFNIISISVAIGLLILISSLTYFKTKTKITKDFLRCALRYELLFLAIFATLITYKLYRSEISDIEKFMDFGYLNAILKTPYFPPIDPWFAGHPMNYYYFGHLVTAVLTKITGIKSAIAYNLMQATNYALFITAVFSVGYNLTKKYWAAFLTAFIAAAMSNISYLVFMAQKVQSYWWEGTRIIPGTINEFPLYSFLLGDLHAHFLDLPFVLLTLIGLYLFFVKSDNRYSLKIFIGFVLGILFMINSWDFLVYGGFFAILSIYKNFVREGNYLQVAWDGLTTGACSLFVLLPFYLTFHPASGGFQLVTAPKSLLSDFLILFLLQVFALSSYLIYKFIKSKSKYTLLALSLSLLMALLVYASSQVTALVLLLVPIWVMVVVYDLKTNKKPEISQFVNLLILMAFSIIVFCEFVYLKDIYTIDFQRANTVFKFYYQLWVIFSLILGYIFYYFTTVKDKLRYVFLAIGGILLILSSAYLPTMINASASSFKNLMGLDGSKYLAKVLPYDAKAVNWINANLSDAVVIAEKPGESYTTDSRISVFTGNSTPLGWLGHEWGWRNNPDELNQVKNDIDTLYTTNKAADATKVTAKYKINYIYFGELESQKYHPIHWIIPSLYKRVYHNDRVSIYEIR